MGNIPFKVCGCDLPMNVVKLIYFPLHDRLSAEQTTNIMLSIINLLVSYLNITTGKCPLMQREMAEKPGQWEI